MTDPNTVPPGHTDVPASQLREKARQLAIRLGVYRMDRRLKKVLGIGKKYWMNSPPYNEDVQRQVRAALDVVRYGAIALALTRIQKEHMQGDLAEVGVYQGELSQFIASVAPQHRLHLFDTFAGFASTDAESSHEAASDTRFRDTGVEAVRRRLGALATNVVFHPGWFPQTASELHDERFAFVMLDVDKYKPTLAGLQVFYPRMQPGGYVFLHDYNSPDSNHGVARAVHEFLVDKPERPIEFPDRSGSLAFRKF